MPFLPKGVFLFLLAVLLCVAAATLDSEESQKEEEAGGSATERVTDGGTHGAPEQPQGLQVLPEGPSSILVTWTKSSGADHYNVYVEGEDMENTTTSAYYVWNNLEPCTTYTFGVTAVSAEGDMSEPALGPGQTEVGPAPAPQNLHVDSYTSMTVTLTWGKPDTLCDIEHYTVKYSKEGSSQIQDTQVSGTAFTVTNLLPNTTYTFEVNAATSYGDGPAASVQHTTAVDDGGPPEDLVAEGVNTAAINVSWSAPHYYTKPQYYLVQAPPCSYSNEMVYGLQYLITGLEPCTRCYIAVTSFYSDNFQYTAQTSASSKLGGAPPQPAYCSVDVQESLIKVSWERPVTECIVGNYSVDWTWKRLWGDEEEGSDSKNTTGTSQIVYNPIPYSEYSFEISASVDGVFGSPVSCNDTSQESRPGPPVLLAVDSEQGEVLATWDTPAEENGVIMYYGIFVDDFEKPRKNTSADTHSTSLRLDPCEYVSLLVKAYNHAGWGERSEVKSVTVVEDVLPNEVRCFEHDGEVEVCWEPYSSTCPVSQYNLQWEGDVLWSDNTDSSSTTIEWNNTVICYSFNAIPYTEYRVKLGVGTNPGYRECTDTTPMAAPGPPTLEEVQTESVTINVTWKEPEEKNGILDFYQVQWTGNSSGVEDFHSTEDNSTFSYQIIGFSCGENVTVTVSATTTNVSEFGEKSSPQTAYLVNSVKILDCFSTTPGQISLNWTLEDPDCRVSTYNLTWTYESLWSDETGASWKPVGGGDTSATVKELPAYASVSVELHVDNVPENARCITTTPEKASSAPTQLEQIANDTNSVTIGWSLPESVRGKLSGWHLNWTTLNGDHPGEQNITDANTRECEIENLLPSKTYVVYVMAVNGAGIGEPGPVNASTRFTNESSSSDLGLILGLSIGGGVLLIILLVGGAILYRKKKTTKPPRSAPYMPDAADADSDELYKNQHLSSASQRFQNRIETGDFGTDRELYTSPRPSLPKDETAADDVEEGHADGQQTFPGDNKGIMFGAPADRRLSQQVASNLPRLGEMNRRSSQQVNIRMRNFEEFNRRPSQQDLLTAPDSRVHSRPISGDVGRPNFGQYGRRPSQQIPMPNLSAYGRRPSQQIDLSEHKLRENERRLSVQIDRRRPSEPAYARRSSLAGNTGRPRIEDYGRRSSQQIPAYRPTSEGRRPSQPATPNRPEYDYRRRASQQADIGRPMNREFMRRPSQQFVPSFDKIQEL